MTVRVTHAFQSGKANGVDNTLLQPSTWNDEHLFTMATARVLGRLTSGTGAMEELDADDVYTLLGWVATTAVPFVQTAVPTGWTKQSTYNDYALRVVSGSVSTGGSIAFSTLAAVNTTDSTVLDSTKIPAHTHTYSGTTSTAGAHTHTVRVPKAHGSKSSSTSSGSGWLDPSGNDTNTGTQVAHTHALSGTFGSTGSATGHAHSISLNVQYVDIVYGTKD
jgi:microcystin-dependent protein